MRDIDFQTALRFLLFIRGNIPRAFFRHYRGLTASELEQSLEQLENFLLREYDNYYRHRLGLEILPPVYKYEETSPVPDSAE